MIRMVTVWHFTGVDIMSGRGRGFLVIRVCARPIAEAQGEGNVMRAMHVFSLGAFPNAVISVHAPRILAVFVMAGDIVIPLVDSFHSIGGTLHSTDGTMSRHLILRQVFRYVGRDFLDTLFGEVSGCFDTPAHCLTSDHSGGSFGYSGQTKHASNRGSCMPDRYVD